MHAISSRLNRGRYYIGNLRHAELLEVQEQFRNPMKFYEALKEFPQLTQVYFFHQDKPPKNWDKCGTFE